jgi:N-methylhydantoinase A
MQWIGVDVGGTFTDIVVYDEDSATLRLGKVPSTPADPTLGVLNGLAKLGVDPATAGRIVHGMTIGTNAILERRGATVWVLTTEGFGDVLEIARTNRTTLYNIKTIKPRPLVPRQRMIEITERMAFDGTPRRRLDEPEVRSAVAKLGRDAEAVAVCFLHSYANPTHELRAAGIVETMLPHAFVCASSEVLPEFREYERFTTTVLNAYIGPLVGRYLNSLSRALEARAYHAPLLTMTSSGGVATAQRAARFPVHTVLSGPAGGVAGALHVGAALGVQNLITYDMGGTSTDVCLIEGLQAPVTSEQLIGGFPNRTPQIEINSVGAGGGSIAWLDAGGILKVGPRSAGADPGPACYGRGGTEPTVSDANLLLHRLKPGACLAGEIVLDARRAETAMVALRDRMGRALDIHQLADGIIRIAVARMVSAIKEISIAKGYDPRDFTLLAYGGAGPMHAAFIAADLEIPRVIVPLGPGNFSAFGSLISDLRHDYVRTRLLEMRRASADEVRATFAEMEREAREALLKEGIGPDNVLVQRAVGMRYVGQSWELVVRLPDAAATMEDIERLFRQVHERRYGHSHDGPAEIVAFRLTAMGRVPKPTLQKSLVSGTLDDARIEARRTSFDGAFQPVPVYDRDRLPAGVRFRGPALIEEMGAVTVLPSGWTSSVGELGELILERGRL